MVLHVLSLSSSLPPCTEVGFGTVSHPSLTLNGIEERELILTRQRANRVSGPRAALFKRICPAFDGKYFCASEG